MSPWVPRTPFGGSWPTDDTNGGQLAFFSQEELVHRHVGTGEYRGSSSSTSTPRRIINTVPAASSMPSATPSTPTGAAATPAPTASPAPPTSTSGLGIGEDFERKLVVKVNAVERVRAELRSHRWAGRPHRHGDQHRPLPTVRGQVPPHPGDHRGPGRGGQPLLHPHQVDADPARPRPAGRGGRRGPTCAATSPSARSTRRCGRRPSRAPPTHASG